MGVHRYEDIRRLIRFDDKRTRAVRLETDHMAAFRYVWDCFLANCKRVFVPSDCVTIDEQLVPFRGRCKFLQYMPSKPAKYGIKIFWMCDARVPYAFDGIIYTGRQPGEDVQRNLGENIVQQLTSGIRHTGEYRIQSIHTVNILLKFKHNTWMTFPLFHSVYFILYCHWEKLINLYAYNEIKYIAVLHNNNQ